MSTQAQDRQSVTNNDHALCNDDDYLKQWKLGIISDKEYMLKEFGITDNGNNDGLWPDTSKDW